MEEIISGGEVRPYRLYVPRSHQTQNAMPLVLGFHGNAGHPDEFESYSGLSTLAEQFGFIAVYPQGSGNPPTWTTWQNSKDVQFIRDLIADLEARCNIDKSRIYAVGHSLGGGMANRLACDLSEQIAAIGSVSGAYQYMENCHPTRPISIFAFHATGDSVISYNGFPNTQSGPPQAYFTIGTPIPQWASGWAERNGCNKKSIVAFQNTQMNEQRWGNCLGNTEVILYTIIGGSHNWPSDLNPAQVIWKFFVKHSLHYTSSN